MTRSRLILGVLAVGLVGAGALAARSLAGSTTNVISESGPVVPTARVSRGTLELIVHMNGDLRATRQVSLTAPSVGGALRVLKVLETGTTVNEGDVIMEFDPADQLYALEQAESQVLEADQEITKRRADAETQAAQDKLALLTARFDLRRAELDATVDADLIAANELKIRQVTLQEAKRKVLQAEQDIAARAVTTKAALMVLEERRTRQKLLADRARQNIDILVVKASIGGTVSVRDNMDASGGMFFSGMTLPPYRVGDSVFSGRPVIDVFDLLEHGDQGNGQRAGTGQCVGAPAGTGHIECGARRVVQVESSPPSPASAGRTAMPARSVSSRSHSSSNGPMRVCDRVHRSRSSFKARASRTRSNCPDKRYSRRTANRSCTFAAPVPQVSRAAKSRFFTAPKVGWRSTGWPREPRWLLSIRTRH